MSFKTKLLIINASKLSFTTDSQKIRNLHYKRCSNASENVPKCKWKLKEKSLFYKNVLEAKKQGSEIPHGAKVIAIDFSSPNIAKPFHVGHLRSTIIGNFIANINKHFKNKVIKINYLGDWGTQFGLLQYGLKCKSINTFDISKNPIKVLFEAYVYANKLAQTNSTVQDEARKYFTNVEQGNEDLANWKLIRSLTVQELEKVYKRLGIEFDEYHWESDYNRKAIEYVIEMLQKKHITRTDETGKTVAEVNNRKITVLKSDNSSLYISRDIAALLDRYNRYNFDEMLYVVDNSQVDHFAAVFDIIKKLNNNMNCKHIKFGRIKGMSTRSGQVVFLNDILDEAKLKMSEKQKLSKNTRESAMNEDTCEILGTTAVIINDLKQRRQKDYVFDWDKALQSEGDSGIKLQYLHCRLWSLEKNCSVSLPDHCDPDLLQEDIVETVLIELSKFDKILLKAHEEYEACIIVTYLFRLAKHVNRMFNELRVRNVSIPLAEQRLLVFHSARMVVKTSLEILGVQPLYEM